MLMLAGAVKIAPEAGLVMLTVTKADAGLTVTVISSVVLIKPSLALSRRTYVPACEKLTVVLAALALAKVAVPGPLTLLHWRVSAFGGLGKPSSLAVPLRLALLGKVMVWSGPALTTGR